MANIEKTIINLKGNNYEVYYVNNKNEVIELISSIIDTNSIVSWGGSKTLEECGVYEYLKANNKCLDRDENGVNRNEIMRQALTCDYYISSTNAITEQGELYNVDGLGNRIAALAYGPEKVIIIAGINKIVENLAQAAIRVKTIAAPLNAARLNCDTYCKTNGKCVSLLSNDSYLSQGCSSSSRICCEYLISGYQRRKRFTIILVNESLGY